MYLKPPISRSGPAPKVSLCQRVDFIPGGPKNGTFFVRLNFINYLPIFKIISLSESGQTCNNTITKDPTTPQVCRYTTL